MKPNVFLTIITILLTCLLSYFAFSVAEGQENDTICGIGSSICIFATLFPMIGLKYDSARIGTNIRILSSLFLFAFIVSHTYFIYWGIRMPYYIIANGILIVIFFAILYKLAGEQENEV